MAGGSIMDLLTAMQVYKELADRYERQGQAAMRDRFLILAAEAAFASGSPDEAERLRQRLLQGNPHHMLKPFTSFTQALQSPNIQIYIHDLQVNYPPETAEALLHDLQNSVSPAPSANEADTLLQTEPRINPVIPIRDEPTQPLGPATEPLKVYPLRDEPAGQPAQSNRPVSRKAATPLPHPRSQPMPPPLETAGPAGAWLTLILFGMTVTAGIALAFYTLARPFLPAP
jgi:hypothetical protein